MNLCEKEDSSHLMFTAKKGKLQSVLVFIKLYSKLAKKITFFGKQNFTKDHTPAKFDPEMPLYFVAFSSNTHKRIAA